MVSLSTAWSPSSYQIRFSFEFRKCAPHPLLVRTRVLGNDRRWRAVARNCGLVGAERGRAGCGGGGTWSCLAASSDELSDWSGDGELLPHESQQKPELGGIVGAALAGVFLVTGLTFASLAIGKRTTSRVEQEMKSLSQEQEVLLSSSEEADLGEEDEKHGSYIVQDEGNLSDDHVQESKAGAAENSSSSSEFTKGVNGDTLKDNDVDSATEDYEHRSSNYSTSIKEDLSYDRALDGPNSPHISPSSQQLTDLDVADGLAYTSGLTDSDVLPTANLHIIEPTNKSLQASHLKIIDSTDLEKGLESNTLPDRYQSSPGFVSLIPSEHTSLNHSTSPNLDVSNLVRRGNEETTNSPDDEDFDSRETIQVSYEKMGFVLDNNSADDLSKGVPSELNQSYADKQGEIVRNNMDNPSSRSSFEYSGIPAPSALFASLLVPPGKVLVPAIVDQVHGQALAALQVLKVIEPDAQPSHLCTRREYARWLLSASGTLSRNPISKVYPAMYIENVTELAFDDIAPEDPDFVSIQGLAEAGLISSKLSRRDMLSSSEEDMGPLYFFPDSPLSRQDLVTWKIALEKRQLPAADRKILWQLSGFIDIDRIDPDAWPALVADISAGEHGITALAFGYTRLFQPDKPVTKAQAAIAISTGEAADMVSEELARIEAESVAESAVAAHSALVAEVEKDVNENFEKELLIEREKIDAVEKMAEEARQELERLRSERERDNVALMKERAAIDSEMELLSRLRHEVEEQLESLMSKKVEISYEKERIEKLQKETEEENQSISRLQYELEVERKALSMARAWAEDEAKELESMQRHWKLIAREWWERHGIKVVVDDELREEASAEVTWLQMEKGAFS
ncbi:hypothetical protein Dimus_000257 [Dionaea muscipula]